MSFKQWLLTEEQGRYKNLAVFDFDGTVVHSPTKPQPHEDNRDWNGKDWWGSPHSLLSPEHGGFYNGGYNVEVVDAFKKAKADPSTYAILLTGRRGVVAPHVRNVLRGLGLYGKRNIHPDNHAELSHSQQVVDSGLDQKHPEEDHPHAHDEFYTGDHTKASGYPTRYSKKRKMDVPDDGTFSHKSHVLESLIAKNGGYEKVDLWDDRADHLDMFKKLAQNYVKNNVVKEFIIHQVFEPKHHGQQASVVHYPITADSQWNA